MDNKSSNPRYAQRLEPEEAQKHLAVLIDADNAQATIVEGLFEEIAKFGVASVKRIYGDWTAPQLGSWKKCCSNTPSIRFSNLPIPRGRTPPTAH